MTGALNLRAGPPLHVRRQTHGCYSKCTAGAAALPGDSEGFRLGVSFPSTRRQLRSSPSSSIVLRNRVLLLLFVCALRDALNVAGDTGAIGEHGVLDDDSDLFFAEQNTNLFPPTPISSVGFLGDDTPDEFDDDREDAEDVRMRMRELESGFQEWKLVQPPNGQDKRGRAAEADLAERQYRVGETERVSGNEFSASVNEWLSPPVEMVKHSGAKENSTANQQSEASNPQTKAPDQQTNRPNPQTKASNPQTKASNPQTKASNQQNKAPHQQRKTPNPQSKTPSPQTKAPNQQRKTPNSQSKTPNSQSKTPNPQSKTPNQQRKTPNTQSKTPTPQTKTPNPQTKAPNQQTKAPNQQANTPSPQTKTPNPQTKTPNLQTKTPNPQAKAPNPQAKAPKQHNNVPDAKERPLINTANISRQNRLHVPAAARATRAAGEVRKKQVLKGELQQAIRVQEEVARKTAVTETETKSRNKKRRRENGGKREAEARQPAASVERKTEAISPLANVSGIFVANSFFKPPLNVANFENVYVDGVEFAPRGDRYGHCAFLCIRKNSSPKHLTRSVRHTKINQSIA